MSELFFSCPGGGPGTVLYVAVAALVGFAETIVSAFVVEKVGQIAERTGGYYAVFLIFGGLFTFSLLVVIFLLPARWLQTE